MVKFKISFEEVVSKRYDVELEVSDGTTIGEMDTICDTLQRKNEFANHLIDDLRIRGFKLNSIVEGAENGKIEIDELEEV